ncbi:type II secretion system protein [bacterium]|nr:type II secretion system protein [bacterium]
METSRRSFTLIEILITLVILGILITPFTRIIWFGKKGVINIKNKTIVDNLAREKIEELTLLRFTRIKSDFEVFSSVFRGTHHEAFIDMDENSELFKRNFTDIFTKKLKKKFPRIFEKFVRKYKKYYGRDYELYPDEYSGYRRVVTVEVEEYPENPMIKIKNIIVELFDKGNSQSLCRYVILRTDDGM